MPDFKLPFIYATVTNNTNPNDLVVSEWTVIISEPGIFGIDPATFILTEPITRLVCPTSTQEEEVLNQKIFPTYQDAWNYVQDWWVVQ